MYDSMEDETYDVAASLSDVREMLPENADHEFAEIVQHVVEQDAGWAWAGFWDMVHKNLISPSCEVRMADQPHLRPPESEVHACVRSLLSRFEQRPEFPWLGERVHATAKACHAAIND